MDRGRAVLTVAHRLAVAREADRVFVMDAGKIVESGRPEELIRRGGRFAAFNLQSRISFGESFLAEQKPHLSLCQRGRLGTKRNPRALRRSHQQMHKIGVAQGTPHPKDWVISS